MSWHIFLASLVVIWLSTQLPSSSITGRVFSLIAVMLGACILVSASLRLVPGDPIDHILGEQALSSSRELLAKDLRLHNEKGEPLSFVEQYSNFIIDLFRFDIKSYITRRNAISQIADRMPYTLMLALCAMVIAIGLGPSLGIIASLFYKRWPDHILSMMALVGISIPSFFLGPLLLLMFAIRLPIFPISGADDGLLSLALPALAMGSALAAVLARMSRASMLEIISEDYIRTAVAKGLSSRVVFFKHALRNALIPIVTIIGLQFGAILAGTVVTEKIFNWPGIGLLLFESIQRLDLPQVQICVLVIAFMYALINLLTDVIYTIIDPRISFRDKS